jgi:hypothetical protein
MIRCQEEKITREYEAVRLKGKWAGRSPNEGREWEQRRGGRM